MCTVNTAGTSVTTEQSLFVLPDEDGDINTAIFLNCTVDPAPSLTFFTPIGWILPSGTEVRAFSFEPVNRIAVISSPIFEEDGSIKLQFNLLITQLSYSDAGTYLCQYEENGETLSASVDLVLSGI